MTCYPTLDNILGSTGARLVTPIDVVLTPVELGPGKGPQPQRRFKALQRHNYTLPQLRLGASRRAFRRAIGTMKVTGKDIIVSEKLRNPAYVRSCERMHVFDMQQINHHHCNTSHDT